jgi:hypothetical protein
VSVSQPPSERYINTPHPDDADGRRPFRRTAAGSDLRPAGKHVQQRPDHGPRTLVSDGVESGRRERHGVSGLTETGGIIDLQMRHFPHADATMVRKRFRQMESKLPLSFRRWANSGFTILFRTA